MRIVLKWGGLLAAFWLVTAGSLPAAAHGGVDMQNDVCRMKVGPYAMHFTGYQPERAVSQEFCEDIPYEGKAIIVLDEVDKKLREMPFEFRVLKDVKNLGVTAQLEQLGSKEDIESATIDLHEFKVYPQGTLNFELNFEKGHYIGLVTLKDDSANQEYHCVFPFSVGYGLKLTFLQYVEIAAGILIVGGLILAGLMRHRLKRANA